MTLKVHVELTARDAMNGVERDDVIVVIDVLRCSSTIVTALANGASEIVPVRTVKKARQIKQRCSDYILAGERKGLKPKGFDLGNSPREFTSKIVRGASIVLTTTDGTQALATAQSAKHVLIGSLLNAEAVGKELYRLARKHNLGVSLVACGKKGKFSLEDFVSAGKILENMSTDEFTLSDTAWAALLASQGMGERNLELIRSSEHSQYLEDIGLQGDIEFCAKINRYTCVPALKNNRITCLTPIT